MKEEKKKLKNDGKMLTLGHGCYFGGGRVWGSNRAERTDVFSIPPLLPIQPCRKENFPPGTFSFSFFFAAAAAAAAAAAVEHVFLNPSYPWVVVVVVVVMVTAAVAVRLEYFVPLKRE